ncbi:hypothetical protein QCD79_19390, partial [Pseudomonas quasicaspiana]|nr:hypothetical protein [Pseudomonas quasicaspiana]
YQEKCFAAFGSSYKKCISIQQFARCLTRAAPVSLTPRCRAANIGSVGAHEHREAAMAVYQTGRNRCLAVLVSSYRKSFQVK